MTKNAAVATLLAVMVVVIVTLDVAFFRHAFWPRLLVNVGVVLVFVAFYLRFLKRT